VSAIHEELDAVKKEIEEQKTNLKAQSSSKDNKKVFTTQPLCLFLHLTSS